MLTKTFEAADIEARISRAWEEAGCFAAGAGGASSTATAPGRVGKVEPYCIMLPPPNVTGSLHMGHALDHTLQDILARYHRMKGRDVLWQPGTDHAGIATQMVVERQLMERQQPGRRELTEKHGEAEARRIFLEKVWAWKAESGGMIVEQQKRLGESCDWSRQRFTMDEGLSKAVTKVFVDLYNTLPDGSPRTSPDQKGLIYKDKRLVNWDPKLLTAISDLEVVQIEKRGSFAWSRGDKTPEGEPKPFDATAFGKVIDREPNGHMYYFRYPLADGAAFDFPIPGKRGKAAKERRDYIVVATTRPETMLGDTAVAVHPTDKRYKALVKAGAKVALPLTGRLIPIVADEYADPEQGTGAVKITPAHDFNDFEVGRRHNLAQINIFDSTGTVLSALSYHPTPTSQVYEITAVATDIAGLNRFEARKKVVGELAALGLLEKIEPHTHKVPHGDRSNVVIEPYLTDQWYVDAKTLAKPAIKAVEDGRTRFVPENWAKTYFHWMENIEPWCISRQLWWGHKIPAWYFLKDAEVDERRIDLTALNAPFRGGVRDNTQFDFVVAHTELEAFELIRKKYPMLEAMPVVDGGAALVLWQKTGNVGFFRDPDVLDTWFSSALWPFSTLGWPDETPELARYYPTSVLVTGFDIIFFWIARMMMMGLHFMKDVPFRDVCIHAIVRDEKGQKMSKSKGNVIDPIETIDEYGADALRFTLAALAAQGRDVKMSAQRVEGYRNFATKLWNASRFAEMNGCVSQPGFDPRNAKLAVNRWIAGEAEAAVAAVAAGIEAYKFNDAATAAYQFVWNTFCDWYVELVKPVLLGADAAAKAETQAMTAWTLEVIVKLLHPFMPFITEELWAKQGELAERPRETMLAVSDWPELKGLRDEAAAAEIEWVIAATSEIRSALAEFALPAGVKPEAVFVASGSEKKRVEAWKAEIARIARLKGVSVGKTPPKGSVQIVLPGAVAALPLARHIDIAAEAARIAKQRAQAEAEIAKVDAKLGNAEFMAKAPEHIVEENRERRAANEAIIKKLAAALKRIEAAV